MNINNAHCTGPRASKRPSLAAKHTAAAAPRRREFGVTLVELMVAMLLGLLLTAGIVKVFIGNRATYAFTDSLSQIQENARMTLDHIAYTSRMAGARGCLADVALFNNFKVPNNFRDDLAGGVQGYDSNGTGAGETYAATAMDPAPSTNAADWTPGLPTELANRVIPGSDVLVVRGVAGVPAPLVSPFSTTTHLYINTPHTLRRADVVVVSDCQKASIFQLTNVNNGVTPSALRHHAGAALTPGNLAAAWPAEQSYGLGAEISKLETHAFYVGQGANGGPSLFQLRLQRLNSTTADFDAEELAEGIDSMQVRYGVDTDNDNAIDNWFSADGVADWTAVLSIEITLLARASDEYGTETDAVVYDLNGTQFNPVDDRRLRQVFSTTIGLRNRLP